MVEIIRAVKFSYEPTAETERLLHDFRDMLNFCLKRAFETDSFSIKKLHHACYKRLRAKYNYNSQYIVSAIKVAVSMISSWKRTRGRKPVAKKLFIQFSPLLTRFEGGKLRISVKPREFLTIPLKFGSYQEKFIRAWREGKLKIGEISMNESWIIVPFKQEIDLTKPNEAVAIDINENNITAIDSNGNCLNSYPNEMEKIIKLYKQGKGIYAIAKLMKRSTSTIYEGLKKGGVKIRNHSEACYMIGKNINLEPSPVLSYVLGVLLGDVTLFGRMGQVL